MRQQPDLGGLQLLLLRLAESMDRVMISAQHTLLTQDMDQVARMLANNHAIDRLRADLEAEAHRLLAQQPAPLGEQLRMVTATLVLADELRRIGDYASEIVTIMKESGPSTTLNMPTECNQMAYRAREMFQEAIRAVITRDASAVERLRVANDNVSALHQHIGQTLYMTARTHAELIKPAIDLLRVAYNLQCMANSGVRIAERAAFIATGSWPIHASRNAIPPATARRFVQDA